MPGNGAWFGNLQIAAGLEKGEFDGNNWSDGDATSGSRRPRASTP